MSVKKGDYWSMTSFGIVTDKNKSDGFRTYFSVKDDDGREYNVENSLDKLFRFHDQHSETKQVTKTEMSYVFQSNTRIIMTVNFNKQLKDKDFVDKIVEFYPNNSGRLKARKVFESEIKSAVKDLLRGEERTIIGRHYGTTDDFGRIKFIDMEQERDPGKEYDTRNRLVDPRTINWMIVDNVRYELK